jgi:hypothetical protein
VTSPDDERDRIRDLDDLTSVPVADRPASAQSDQPEQPRDDGGDPGSGVGDVPTASPPSHSMPGTAEELPPVDGVFAPPGDEPAT